MQTSSHGRADAPWSFLCRCWEGQLPFQTDFEFGNGLKIQSHTRVVCGNGWLNLKCKCVETTNNQEEIVVSAYWNLCPAKMRIISRVAKLMTYLRWRTKCTNAKGEGRKEMNKQFSVETAVCAEHQRLLEESERALEIWKDRRAEFCHPHLSGREAGDELLRLQAKYARAYTVLRNHAHNCSLCQLVSRMEGRDTENSSRAHSRGELQTCF